MEAARKEEERIMLRDARQWLNSGHVSDVRHAKSGGTALHVAAAKGYTEVLKYVYRTYNSIIVLIFCNSHSNVLIRRFGLSTSFRNFGPPNKKNKPAPILPCL